MSNLKIGFAGTPVFAARALAALVEAHFEVACVLTQPDRPSGRGMNLQASPVKQYAQAQNIAVFQPQSLRLDGAHAQEAQALRATLESIDVDVWVVAAYGLILPLWFLQMPAKGCINIHASLLPRWRGAAPIQRAIEAGDAQTGVTLMLMDQGLDTGDIITMQSCDIEPQDTTLTLHDKLAHLGAQMIVQQVRQLQDGEVSHYSQPEQGITYAQKINKPETWLDVYHEDALTLEKKIRAFYPYPGARLMLKSAELDQNWMKISRAIAYPEQSTVVGQVMQVSDEGIDIGTLKGVLRLTEIQKPGGKSLPVAEVLRGWSLAKGSQIVCPFP